MDPSSSQGFPSSPGMGRAAGHVNGTQARLHPGNLGGLPSSSSAGESDGGHHVRAPPNAGAGRRGHVAPDRDEDDEEDERERDRDRGDEAAEEGVGGNRGGNRGARARNLRDINDIPSVSDQTGEKVRESFEHFLERCARSQSIFVLLLQSSKEADETRSTASKKMKQHNLQLGVLPQVQVKTMMMENDSFMSNKSPK
jgi:hypothetical protein